MQEHTIPESLIDQIKAGRAVLVVGAGIGIPSWKQLLEKMNEQLKDREQDGDDAAVKDVAKLLSKGSLTRATGFLARSLGEEACDAIVAETWAPPEELPEVARALARLPFRHVWTTFPGDLLERAMHAERPDDWPLPEVLTYEQTDAVSKRQRTLLKVLGDFDSYVVTPKSVRNALSSATGLREYAREFYSDGLLLFVGFRFGDPDLSALLDRVFGLFELPAHNHYLVGSGIGPVTMDELENDHHIEAINLPGKGADETAAQSLLEYLTSLERALREAGLTLARSMPDDDDLEGWLALSDHEPEAVREALGRMEAAARGSSDAERLIDILFARVEHTEHSAKGRAALLRELAVLFETEIGDLPQAFTALTMALRQDPADTTAVDEAERLAGDTDGWTELITDVSQVAGEIEDPAVASGYFARLGRWYDQHLDHGDYAVTSYRHALKLDRTQLGAYSGLEEVYRKQQRWGDLADVLADHVELEDDAGHKVDLYLAIGDLCENQLASTARAIEAYQHALELERESDDTLAALERLYRRDERWGKLAEILEQRAAHLDATDSQRAAAIRRELATVRADKLGDLDGAISKYEAAVAADESDLEALRALEGLYDKIGRAGDYLRTLERLVDLLPDSEKPTLLRRLAAEIDDKEPRRAIECYERIIALEATGTAADDAYRALERLLRAEADWYELVSAYERHIDAVRAPGQRVDLFQQLADVYDKELDDPHRALEAHLSVLELEAENQASLKAGARLYQRTESWQRAIDLLVKHAELEGKRGAGLWLAAGALATEHLGELGMDRAQASKRAETYLEKSLELDPGSHATMVALATLHKARSSWANAVDLLIRAESSTHNRIERVELLVDAATITAEHLGDSERALGLLLSVLELDPERVDVGERAWPALIAAERWKEAIPILEMLARRGEDKLERARARTTLGRAHEALGDYGKAAEHYRAAAEIDRDSLEAALGLASMLFADAKQHMNQSAGAMSEDLIARWDEVDKTYREILARHRSGLADSQVVEIWYRLGMSARATGADKKADNAFRRALELEPSHQLALGALIDVAKARGDWKTVVEARREQIDTLKDQPEDKLTLLTEMGDIYHGELKDPTSALGAYLEGLTLHPHSYVLLHKLLNIYTEQGEWRRAVDTLATLAEHEAQAERRSRYRYAAAVIARDEIADVDLAVAHFNLVLDDVPGNGKAFDAIDKLLSERGDYKNLARAYRKMLARVGESAPIESLLPLWTRLGEICLDHLGDLEAAIYAFEVASSLEPESTDRHEQLANLYLESGESRRSEAIFELQVLIHRDPDRVELYRALSDLFRESGELDRAFCLAQALVFLGAANAEEAALFAGNRPASFTVARRRITEELWTKSVIHESEDRHVSALFAALIGAIAATTAQPGCALGLAAGDRAQIGRDATRVIARVFKYASDILALDPEPHLYLQPDSQSIKVVNTREDGYLVPSVLVGEPHISAKDERVLAFEVGKRMAYFRPERYVVFALDSLPKLELAYSAALAAAGASAGAELSREIARMASTLEKTVPASVLEQVRLIAGTLADRSGASVLPAWRSATDLTADRVGLILCNDLETAARLVATETAAMSTLTTKDRLRQLLLYSVSESYATVRRHLGLSVGDNR